MEISYRYHITMVIFCCCSKWNIMKVSKHWKRAKVTYHIADMFFFDTHVLVSSNYLFTVVRPLLQHESDIHYFLIIFRAGGKSSLLCTLLFINNFHPVFKLAFCQMTLRPSNRSLKSWKKICTQVVKTFDLLMDICWLDIFWVVGFGSLLKWH